MMLVVISVSERTYKRQGMVQEMRTLQAEGARWELSAPESLRMLDTASSSFASEYFIK